MKAKKGKGFRGWKVYLVKCSDGTYYTGIAKDVAKRVHMHNQGMGAKYTMGRTPVTLIVVSPYLSESHAKTLEYVVKQAPKHEKTKLIARQWKWRSE